jgi:exonuclease VII small subunit
VVPSLASKPDTVALSAKLVGGALSYEEALDALLQCVEYIENVEMALDDLRDKCAETVRLLG